MSIGENDNELYSDRENIVTLESYNNFVSSDNVGYEGVYTFENGVVSTIMNISIANTGNTAMKLYSIFPGNRDVTINKSTSSYVNKNGYCDGANNGVYFRYNYSNNDSGLQTQNQFITFRMNDAWTGEAYYGGGKNCQSATGIENITSAQKLNMVIYPYVTTKYGLCIDSDDVRSYVVINPGEEIIVPMYCAFVASEPSSQVERTISFDLRTSLYNDPVNYSFKVVGKNTASIQDQLLNINKRRFWGRLFNPVKYHQTIK